jgi:hypothetical protein
MLALFRSDEPSYRPEHPSKSLQPEDGNPQASLENLTRLGLPIQTIWVRKGLSRVLIQFSTGETYLALGLGKGDVLAVVASKAGFGPCDQLKLIYNLLPADYDGLLPADDDRYGPLPPREYDSDVTVR